MNTQMRVMLVCMQGLTTSVLSAKLTKYGQEQGRKDSFVACKIDLYKELLPHMDAVLISPQAIRAADPLRADASARNIPVINLDEEDFAFSRTDRIYAALLSAVEAAHPSKEPEAAEFRLTLSVLAQLVGKAFLSCAPLLVLGFLALALSRLTGLEWLEHLWQITGGIISLFVLFALGVQYGRASRSGALTCGLLTVAAPIMLLLNADTSIEGLPFRVNIGAIPLEELGLAACIPMTLLGVLAVCVIHLAHRIQPKSGWAAAAINGMSLMAPLFYSGVLFSAFLLLRLGISLLL